MHGLSQSIFYNYKSIFYSHTYCFPFIPSGSPSSIFPHNLFLLIPHNAVFQAVATSFFHTYILLTHPINWKCWRKCIFQELKFAEKEATIHALQLRYLTSLLTCVLAVYKTINCQGSHLHHSLIPASEEAQYLSLPHQSQCLDLTAQTTWAEQSLQQTRV